MATILYIAVAVSIIINGAVDYIRLKENNHGVQAALLCTWNTALVAMLFLLCSGLVGSDIILVRAW